VIVLIRLKPLPGPTEKKKKKSNLWGPGFGRVTVKLN
jgi:hypothetical protein